MITEPPKRSTLYPWQCAWMRRIFCRVGIIMRTNPAACSKPSCRTNRTINNDICCGAWQSGIHVEAMSTEVTANIINVVVQGIGTRTGPACWENWKHCWTISAYRTNPVAPGPSARQNVNKTGYPWAVKKGEFCVTPLILTTAFCLSSPRGVDWMALAG